MQYSINQVVGIPNINHIIIITDSFHAAKRIFDLLSHLYQIHSATISCKLREFFLRTITITLSSRTALANKTGCYTLYWTKIPRALTHSLSSYANHPGIIAKNTNTTLFFLNGKCLFKHQTLKGETF